MESIPKKPDPRDLRYLKLVTARMHGKPDVGLLASEGLESAKELYRCLAADGYPICPECGTLHVDKEHCEPAKKQRKRSGGGDKTELTPPRTAAPVFREAVVALNGCIEKLEYREEYRQNQRFVSQDVLSDDLLMLNRYRWVVKDPEDPNTDFVQVAAFSDEEWCKVCEDHGVDPEENDSVLAHWYTPLFLKGATQRPSKELTALVAASVLAGIPTEVLVELLHPEPADADREIIKRKVEGHLKRPGFIKAAEDLAGVIRGGSGRGSATTGEFSASEHWEHAFIQEKRRKGVSDKVILREMNERREKLGLPLANKDELNVLGDLRLNSPLP